MSRADGEAKGKKMLYVTFVKWAQIYIKSINLFLCKGAVTKYLILL